MLKMHQNMHARKKMYILELENFNVKAESLIFVKKSVI